MDHQVGKMLDHQLMVLQQRFKYTATASQTITFTGTMMIGNNLLMILDLQMFI